MSERGIVVFCLHQFTGGLSLGVSEGLSVVYPEGAQFLETLLSEE